MSSKTILVVDDDADLRRLIAEFLSDHGFSVRQADGAEEMRRQFSTARPDLIVLDLMMPREDGLAAMRSLDGSTRPPIIMLSAMGSDSDRIIGLELGADDYVAKPCNPRELLARVRAVLRRAKVEQCEHIRFGGWDMDLGTRELHAPCGTQVGVTPKEWRLLEAMAASGRRVLSRDELMTRIGGEEEDTFDRAIDIGISRLRRKLAEHDHREIIRTVRGQGYGIALDVTRA